MQIMWEKVGIRSLGIAVFLLLISMQAIADPITLTANTTGTFSQGTCVTCSVDNSLVPTITSTGGGGASAIGFISSTATTNTPQITVSLNSGQSATVTLGTFTAASSIPLGTGPSFTGSTFTLNVNFTVPGGTLPNPGVFTASLTGQLTQSSNGVQFQFSGAPLSFTSGGQTFTLTIQPTTFLINTQTNVPLTAVISLNGAAPVPEPTTLLLLGSGLATLGSFMKRRKKKEL